MKGYAPYLDIHAAHVQCKIEEIMYKVDKISGKELQNSPKSISKGDCAVVKLVPSKSVSIEV